MLMEHIQLQLNDFPAVSDFLGNLQRIPIGSATTFQ